MGKKGGADNNSGGGGGGGGESGGGGGAKGQCDECGVERNDFNHCVHCAQKVCDSCRMKHVEALLEDFMGSREEAATIQRKIYSKCLHDISRALNDLKKSENSSQITIHATFKEIERRLIDRKAQLLKELHVKTEEQINPLLADKLAVEKELYFASDKFKDACKISITPVRGSTASSYNKMPDGEFAQVCVATTKAKESIQEFSDLKTKMDEIAAPNKVKFVYDQSLEQLLDTIQNYGEIAVQSPEDGQKDQKDKSGKGSAASKNTNNNNNNNKQQTKAK